MTIKIDKKIIEEVADFARFYKQKTNVTMTEDQLKVLLVGFEADDAVEGHESLQQYLAEKFPEAWGHLKKGGDELEEGKRFTIH